MEQKKMEHFHETMDRLTAASHVQVEYFAEHNKVEGYYHEKTENNLFGCDRLMKQENMFGKIQLGFNPNRKRVFLSATLKTSRYDTFASSYQTEMEEYQKKPLLRGDNEKRAFVSDSQQQASVLVEKKENKPWTKSSIRKYLNRANTEAVKKSMPFFVKKEEISELLDTRKEQKEIQKQITELRKESAQGEEKIRLLRKKSVDNLAKISLLETILIRKDTAQNSFLRKINYAYDFQKKDIFGNRKNYRIHYII